MIVYYKMKEKAIIVAGWNDITIPSTAVTSGTYYWLAYDSDAAIGYYQTATGTLRYKSKTYSTFTFPSPAGTGFSSATNKVGLLAGWGFASSPNPVAPTVTNATGAGNITDTTARLNGEITNNGGENPTVHIYWGTTDGGTTAGNWAHDINLGIKAAGTFYSDISGLTAGATYYYRCYATNSGGGSWAGVSVTFTTIPRTITWDVENRVVAVTGGASFVYDGDGNRVKKTEGGQTILYINQYYEKNLTTGVVTTSYYLGGQLVAARENTTLRYVHQDSLNSTSVMSTSTGTLDSSITFYPFGATRTGSVSTDKKFTGQRLDGTGLYYYGARYYDATIGRFISADTVGINYNNPQTLNRYSYCSNNPLKYTDPTGHDQVIITNDDGTFTIMDGAGRYLDTATDIDDLAIKMKKCEVKSRDVDLPLQPRAVQYFKDLAAADNTELIVLDSISTVADIVATATILVPPISGIASVVSTVASGFGSLLTYLDWTKGRASVKDCDTSFWNSAFGQIPVLGLFWDYLQLKYDIKAINKAKK